MSHDKINIEIVILQHGQPKRYADSIYEADIKVTRTPGYSMRGEATEPKPQPITKSVAKEIARNMVRSFADAPESWAAATLKKLEPRGGLASNPGEEIRASEWRVRIEQAFTD